MRYLVIGSGAIGGTLGGLLFQAKREVVLVARGAHLAALQAQGLTLKTPERTLTLPVPTVAGPEGVTLREGDVLLLAVKTQDSEALLDAWSRQPVQGGGTAGERLPLVCVQNGVENERLALRRFARVLGVCLWLPASHLEPGVVAAHGAPKVGMVHVGHFPRGADALTRDIAADFTAAGVLAHVSEDVMRWKYNKLLSNLGNALQALCGEAGAPAAARVHDEGQRVLQAAGIAFASRDEERAARGDQVNEVPIAGEPRSGGSSWQSLQRGAGTIESDFLNGEIVLLGRLHGVPTPVNAALQRLANQAAREKWKPGQLSLEAFERAVAGDSTPK